eukprot:6801548-Lingulodinium_polyedra.AAC.1
MRFRCGVCCLYDCLAFGVLVCFIVASAHQDKDILQEVTSPGLSGSVYSVEQAGLAFVSGGRTGTVSPAGTIHQIRK